MVNDSMSPNCPFTESRSVLATAAARRNSLGFGSRASAFSRRLLRLGRAASPLLAFAMPLCGLLLPGTTLAYQADPENIGVYPPLARLPVGFPLRICRSGGVTPDPP